ncbi:hypothetical protein PQR02_15995 [Paraburkholderia sediminicola]|uniref:hypothetical protein n=1 Tax=Paraburkholderia sediminicola TaxID=458836 RepID=UPI0038BA326E
MNDIDDRVPGNKLDLFHQQEEGAGMVFCPRGWGLYRVLEDCVRACMRRADSHVFCAHAHIEAEVGRFCSLLRSVYADLGFPAFEVALATRPASRAGSDATWDRAEHALADAARAAGLAFVLREGEGAFYGRN